jgi:hypothetical protein
VAKLEKLLDQMQEHLDEGEEILATVLGTYTSGDWLRKGILAATDHRLVFFGKKLGGYELEVFPYSQISSIEASKGMTTGSQIKFFASGNAVSLRAILKKYDAPAFVQTVKTQMVASKAPHPGPAPPPDSSTDAADQIRKLAALRDDGLLTDEEYESKRADLLARI